MARADDSPFQFGRGREPAARQDRGARDQNDRRDQNRVPPAPAPRQEPQAQRRDPTPFGGRDQGDRRDNDRRDDRRDDRHDDRRDNDRRDNDRGDGFGRALDQFGRVLLGAVLDSGRRTDYGTSSSYGHYEVRDSRRLIPAQVQSQWVPDRYEDVCIPPVTQRVYVPAHYENGYYCQARYEDRVIQAECRERRLVEAGHWTTVVVCPERWETVHENVWCPGR